MNSASTRPQIRNGWGCRPIAPVAKSDPAAIGRTNDAVLYGGTVHLWIEGGDYEVAELAGRLPSSASEAFDTPFGDRLEAADWSFRRRRPDAVQPRRDVTLTSTESGWAHHGGGLAPEVLERSFASVTQALRVGLAWGERVVALALT